MSRSTPLNQLPQPNQAGLLGDNILPDEDADIQAMASDIRNSALAQQPIQQQQQQQMHATPQIASPEIKLAILILIFFVLFGNDMVATMLAERVPGMSNPWVSLLVRGVVMAALVVVINRVFA